MMQKQQRRSRSGPRPVCVHVRMCALAVSPSSLPHLDDTVSGRRDDEALRRLEGGDVSDDVVVSHREGFWAAARRVLHHAALLFTVNFLHGQETVTSHADRGMMGNTETTDT